MNDIEYTFIQDSREKKNIAHSASKRINGSKSKKCTLPGDYLTSAEKKKLSKDIVSANLKKPMDCDTFRKLSVNLQRQYLEYLRDECGANGGRICKMFERDGSWWFWYTRNKRPELADIFAGHINIDKESREKWKRFLGEEAPKPERGIVVENTPADKEGRFHKSYKVKTNDGDDNMVTDVNLDVKYCGNFSLDTEDVSTEELIELIRKHFGSRDDISFSRISVTFRHS